MGTPIGDILKAIETLAGRIVRPLRLMEVCGTHTVAVFRHGIRGLLPENITLLSGPGCPVCVTPEEDVDAAIAISMMPGTTLATFGDMMRVPGGEGSRGPRPLAGDLGGEAPIKIWTESPLKSLNHAKAEGADVRVVYSPLEALKIASENPHKKIVFFATGFETTSPLVAATLLEAEKSGVKNFHIYSAHKLVPPALRALLDSPGVKPGAEIDGFMLPGHVSTIIGSAPYEFISDRHELPSVITGFGAEDILEGILMLLKQIETKTPSVEIQYKSVVKEEGNPRALFMIDECFTRTSAQWRGMGVIPESGLELKSRYRHRDIKEVMELGGGSPRARGPRRESGGGAPASRCSCGEILRGIRVPTECPLFGKSCTPDAPVGPCMVSEEGSCGAYYRYGG